MRIGLSELIVIAILIIAFFNPKKLPVYANKLNSIMSSIKESMKQLKEATEPVDEIIQPVKDIKDTVDEQIADVKSEVIQKTQ